MALILRQVRPQACRNWRPRRHRRPARRSVHDPAPRGRISLVGAVAAEEAQAQGGRAAFSLKTRSRVFLFECEHDFERPLWVTAINESAGVATAEFAAAANIRKVVAIQRAHRRWRARRKLAERAMPAPRPPHASNSPFLTPSTPDAGTGARGTALRLPQRPTARSSRPLHVPRLLTFVGTWNMGECEAPSAAQLCAWIPAGMDVYAISVQECMFPQRLRGAIALPLQAPTLGHRHSPTPPSACCSLHPRRARGRVRGARPHDRQHQQLARLPRLHRHIPLGQGAYSYPHPCLLPAPPCPALGGPCG